MNRGRAAVAALSAWLVVVVAVSAGLGGPAAASHNRQADELWVTVAINAAGGDSLWVTDQTYSDSRTWSGVAADVAVALGHRVGSFRTVEDDDAAYVELDDKLAQPDDGGGLMWAVDTADLQRLAGQEGYEAVLLEVCTPRVRQTVDSPARPRPLPSDSPGSRCREWYQPVDEPPLRAVVQLFPDRDRYPLAVSRAVGAAVVTFIVLGIGAATLRRALLRRRGVASWLLSIGSAGGVALLGWGVTTFTLWWTGSAADPVLVGGGGVGEQVARTVLPGMVFLVPALLPGTILLTVPRREKPPPAPLAPPLQWSPQWATHSQAPPGVQAPTMPPAPPGPPPPASPPVGASPPTAPPSPAEAPAPPPAPDGSSGWAAPR